MSGVCSVLVWVARLRGRHASVVGVGGVGDVLACVAWVGGMVCLRGWRASRGGMSRMNGMLAWMA